MQVWFRAFRAFFGVTSQYSQDYCPDNAGYYRNFILLYLMRKWTPEQRAKQAENCRRTRPWATSTGARTLRGKAVSRLNASADVLQKRQIRRLTRLLIQLRKIRAEKNELSTKSLESLDSVSNACTLASHEQNEEQKREPDVGRPL
jgi:hypothetical protein